MEQTLKSLNEKLQNTELSDSDRLDLLEQKNAILEGQQFSNQGDTSGLTGQQLIARGLKARQEKKAQY